MTSRLHLEVGMDYMRSISMLSSFAVRFGHRFGLRTTGKRGAGFYPAFGPSGRFTTRFGTLSRCAKLQQNAGHHATHLSRRVRALCAFPRTQDSLAEVFGQQQLIAGHGMFQLQRSTCLGVRRCAWVQSNLA